MLPLESDLYVRECERRFDLERAELRIERGIADEINNAGLGWPDWLTALGRGLGSRLRGRGQRVAVVGATSESIPAGRSRGRRLCVSGHRRQRLICNGCGAVIRTAKPACSAGARRARKPRSAAHRETV